MVKRTWDSRGNAFAGREMIGISDIVVISLAIPCPTWRNKVDFGWHIGFVGRFGSRANGVPRRKRGHRIRVGSSFPPQILGLHLHESPREEEGPETARNGICHLDADIGPRKLASGFPFLRSGNFLYISSLLMEAPVKQAISYHDDTTLPHAHSMAFKESSQFTRQKSSPHHTSI